MLARLVSVSEECRADSGVSGPGAGRRRSGELVRTRTKVFREGGRPDEGAGRNRRTEDFNTATSQLLFVVVSFDNKP